MRRSSVTVGIKTGNWTILSEPYSIRSRWYVDVMCECYNIQSIRVNNLPPSNSESTQCKTCASYYMSNLSRNQEW